MLGDCDYRVVNRVHNWPLVSRCYRMKKRQRERLVDTCRAFLFDNKLEMLSVQKVKVNIGTQVCIALLDLYLERLITWSLFSFDRALVSTHWLWHKWRKQRTCVFGCLTHRENQTKPNQKTCLLKRKGWKMHFELAFTAI